MAFGQADFVAPVEKGIPIPKRRNRKYPWYELEIGDSFLVRCAIHEIEAVECSMTSCRNWAQRQTGWRFIMRRTPLGIRVWRAKTEIEMEERKPAARWKRR